MEDCKAGHILKVSIVKRCIFKCSDEFQGNFKKVHMWDKDGIQAQIGTVLWKTKARLVSQI